MWFYALDVGIWVDDEATTAPPAPTNGTELEQDGTEQPAAPPADDDEGETFPIAAATDGPATNPPATPPAAPPAGDGQQAYDWFVRRMREGTPQPTQPNQSTQPPVDWLARLSDPNDPLGRSFNGPELPPLSGDKPLRPRLVQVVPARDPFALDDNLRTLNSLIASASGQTFDWDRIDYWAKRDAERLRPQLDLAVRVGTVAADVLSIGTEIGIGVTTFEFGGFVLVAHGFDRAVARIESLRTGTPQMSLTADYLFHRTVGLSKADATAADDLAGDLATLSAVGIRGVARSLQSYPPRRVIIQGAAQHPTVKWTPNANGTERSIEEAVEIAKRNGVQIPDDVVFVKADGTISNPNSFAQYTGIRANPGDVIKWSQLYNKDGKIVVRIREDVLLSDEAIAAVFEHEMYELNALRNIFSANKGSLPAETFADLVNPGISGNLHDFAWDAADAIIIRIRGGKK